MKIKVSDLKKLIREQLKVMTFIDGSDISGKGLYSSKFIPAGTIVSQWVEGQDKTYPADHPFSLSASERKTFEEFASWDGETWCISGDDGIYFNHSDDPNVGVVIDSRRPAHWDRIALRDILPGEELTMDYSTIGEMP